MSLIQKRLGDMRRKVALVASEVIILAFRPACSYSAGEPDYGRQGV